MPYAKRQKIAQVAIFCCIYQKKAVTLRDFWHFVFYAQESH